jgi:cell wall-associated NlpC family hydrolase
MTRILSVLCIVLLLFSCGSKKSYPNRKVTTAVSDTISSPVISPDAIRIVDFAKTFDGTRYKYGGTTKRGMDCSGLIYTSFKAHNIDIPRTTGELASTGDWVDLKEVTVGDLVFFATRKNSRKVNHVGLVTDVRPGQVEFIHASTSKGVIISSIAERYWYFAFVQARRVL